MIASRYNTHIKPEMQVRKFKKYLAENTFLFTVAFIVPFGLTTLFVYKMLWK